MVSIIKRRQFSEEYDERKIYASVYSAAINCHITEKDSEKIANSVTLKINRLVKESKLLSSDHIKHRVMEILKADGKDEIVLMYKHHLDLC